MMTDRQVRVAALEHSVKYCTRRFESPTSNTVLDVARKFEEYINDGRKVSTNNS